MINAAAWVNKPPVGWTIDWSHPLAGGLVDYWPANESAGLSIASAGPNGLVGSLSGTTFSSNRLGGCLNFASGNKVTTTGSSYNWERTQPFSVAVWFLVSSTSAGQTFVSTLNVSSNYRGWELSFDQANQTVQFFLISTWSSNAIQQKISIALSANTLYHCAVTYNGSAAAAGIAMYLNGNAVAMSSPYNSLSATIVSTVPLRLGTRSDGSAALVGTLNDLAIWNRVLSASEVAELYAAPWQIFQPLIPPAALVPATVAFAPWYLGDQIGEVYG
jgi:Concanavalin A-like lectin/glucanases superfamily